MSKHLRKKLQKQQADAGIKLVKRGVDGRGKKTVTALPALKWSSHYPNDFCLSVVRFFQEVNAPLLNRPVDI